MKITVPAQTTIQYDTDGTVTILSNVPYKMVLSQKVIDGKPGKGVYRANGQQVTILTD